MLAQTIVFWQSYGLCGLAQQDCSYDIGSNTNMHNAPNTAAVSGVCAFKSVVVLFKKLLASDVGCMPRQVPAAVFGQAFLPVELVTVISGVSA